MKTDIYSNLAQRNITPLFWQYALPAIIGTCVNMLYNIIDGIFIGHWIGSLGLAAAGVILPIMNITAAVGMLVGIGAASRVSIFLGQNDKESAEKIVGTTLLLNLLLTGAVIILILLFLEPVLRLAGATNESLPYAKDFLIVFLPGNLFLSLMFNYNNIMRAAGHPLKAMITMLISVVCNIILAPIFIIVMDLGMKGAALATVCSMFIGFLFVITHFLGKDRDIKLKLKNIRLDWKIIATIVSIGLSPFFMQIAASLVVGVINHQLKLYSVLSAIGEDDAIAAYSNANRFMMLILMIVIGITQGMQPIVGYNYGAKQFDRAKKTFLYASKIATIVTTSGFLVSFFIPDLIMRIFISEAQMVAISARVLKDAMLGYAFIGFPIVIISLFQCINLPKISIFLSLTRQIIALIPLLFILPMFWGFDGVLYAIPISDLLTTFISIFTLSLFYKNFKKRHRIE